MGERPAGGYATIVQHCAVFGRTATVVREWKVDAVWPDAQHPASVSVSFVEPRKRRRHSYTMKADNLRYLTIEAAGRVVYDSRRDVPCDMAAWEAARQRAAVLQPGA